ncbi:MAG: hypothetical protein K2Q14_05680 [Gammaproteobacteria bacterium]|nr:hypothetical protein [Gammaproteobacteria bacterium]
MSKAFNLQHFLRKVPNKFLQQYFTQHNVLTEIEFENVLETKIEPIYQAWLELPENIRNPMEQDFYAIHNMATEAGSKAIIDEATWHGENLALQFSMFKGFYEHAFWTFLERPEYWDGASAFNHADTLTYWRKRKNMPQKNARVDASTVNLLEQEIAKYFIYYTGTWQKLQD